MSHVAALHIQHYEEWQSSLGHTLMYPGLTMKYDACPWFQDEEAKYSKVVKIGNKLYGIPTMTDGEFPTDLQQQTGRRFEELVFELNGEVRGTCKDVNTIAFMSYKQYRHIRGSCIGDEDDGWGCGSVYASYYG